MPPTIPEPEDKARLLRPAVADLLLAVALLAVPAVALVSLLRERGAETVAYVYSNQRLVLAQPLSRDTVIDIHNVEVEVRKGRVRVAHSDCPNQICVRRGWISRAGQTIVCVPNRVVVEVKGSGRERLDAETF